MKKFIKVIIFMLCIVIPTGFCFTGCSEQKFADAWTYDENYHWHASLDENSTEVQFKGEHIMSDWVDNVDAELEESQRYKKCEICEYKIYEPLVPSEGLEYVLSTNSPKDNYYLVKSIGTCTDTTIRIPETHDGLPVKELVYNCFKDATSIKCVVIPDSFVNINKPFENCTSLERVILGKNIRSMYSSFEDIFKTCTSLTDIIFDEENPSYKTIDGNVYSKNGKTMHYYPRGKTEQSFTVLDSVEVIADYCFTKCKLKNITISDSVKRIGDYAFSECALLENVDLGNGVENLGGYTFIWSAIKSITIPESVTSFDSSIFSNCANLESVEFLCNVEELSDFMFQNSGLKTIIIPDCFKKIGQQCFNNCTNLKSVVIDTNITDIDYMAFGGITDLTIYFKGSEAEWNNITKDSNWNKNSSIKIEYNYTGTAG